MSALRHHSTLEASMLPPFCRPGHNQKAVRHRAAVIGRCCVPKLAPCTSRANFVSGIGCMDLRLVPSVLRGRFIQLEPYHEDLKEEVRAALNFDPSSSYRLLGKVCFCTFRSRLSLSY